MVSVYVAMLRWWYYNCFIFKEMSTVEQDRQRSELLKKQLVQMGEDFDFMKKSREEWKKQLDARFQDIERYSPHYSGKYRVANSTSLMKPRGLMTLFWHFNINSSSKSRRPEKIFRTILTPFQSRLMKGSSRRIRKLQTWIKTLRRKQKTEQTSFKKVRKTLSRRLTVLIYSLRNKWSNLERKTGKNTKLERKYGQIKWIPVFAKIAIKARKRWQK